MEKVGQSIMGISIHYKGRLADMSQCQSFFEEIEDIGKCMKWKIFKLDEAWSSPENLEFIHHGDRAETKRNPGLKGVQITPIEDCESLPFFLDKDGNLNSIMNMALIKDGTLKKEDTCISVKTQFAPPEIHIWIIGLLKYLKRKYFPDLYVYDESDYWKTGEKEQLIQKINFIDSKINALKSAVENQEMGDFSNLTAEEIADKLEKYIQKSDK